MKNADLKVGQVFLEVATGKTYTVIRITNAGYVFKNEAGHEHREYSIAVQKSLDNKKWREVL